MQIVKALPPNIDELDLVFGVRKLLAQNPIWFAWGDRIYNPNGVEIPPQTMAHESIHGLQHKMERDAVISLEHGIRAWWLKYLADPAFRLDQEIPAHQAEYQWLVERAHTLKPKKGYRSPLHWYLQQIALRLSGSLYGNLVSLSEAKRLIEARDRISA